MIQYIVGGIIALLVLYVLFFRGTPCEGDAPNCYDNQGDLTSSGVATCDATTKSWTCPSGSCALTPAQYATFSGVKTNVSGTGFTCADYSTQSPNMMCGGQVYTNDVVAPTSCGGQPMPDPSQFCGASTFCFDKDGTFKCVPYCNGDKWGCYMTGDTMSALSKSMGSTLSCDGGNWDSTCGQTSFLHDSQGPYYNYDNPATCSNSAWSYPSS